MDSRKAKRSRSTTAADDAFWDCPLCTYRNKNESFRCEMCNMRKGTSTRKPRISQVTQQLAKIENQIEQERKKEKRKEITMRSRASRKHSKHFKFENAQTISITVNDVTVFITDVELNSHENDDENSKSLSTKSSRSKLEMDSKDSADNTASSDNDSSKNETDTGNNE